MAYSVLSTAIPDVLVLEPRVFPDARGGFFESYNMLDFQRATGLDREFVQDNHSWSHPGAVRGFHYQIEQPQGKLVRVVAGEIFDVAVDLRRSSPSFGRATTVILSSENRRQLWIPEGFAHGFLVTSERAEVLYKTTDYWSAAHERTLLWNDSALGIDWPLSGSPLLAPRDATGTSLASAECFP